MLLGNGELLLIGTELLFGMMRSSGDSGDGYTIL